jgi:hypothetical protein
LVESFDPFRNKVFSKFIPLFIPLRMSGVEKKKFDIENSLM